MVFPSGFVWCSRGFAGQGLVFPPAFPSASPDGVSITSQMISSSSSSARSWNVTGIPRGFEDAQECSGMLGNAGDRDHGTALVMEQDWGVSRIPARSFHPVERKSRRSWISLLDPSCASSVLSSGVHGELVIPSRDYSPVGCWSCGSLPPPPPPPLSFPGAAVSPFLAALPGSWHIPSGSSRSAGRGSERSRGVWNIPDPPGVTPAGRGRERLPPPVPACRAKFGRRAERRDEQVGKSPRCSLAGSVRLFFRIVFGISIGFPAVSRGSLARCQLSFQGFVPEPEPCPGRSLVLSRE